MSEKKLSMKQRVLARLEETTTSEALAIKISKKNLASLRGQVASLQSREIDVESKLEDAKDALERAEVPTKVLDSNTYITNIVNARNYVVTVEDELKDIQDSIEYFKGLSANEEA